MKMRTRTDSHEIQLLRRIALVLGGITLILLVILSLQVHQWKSLHSDTTRVPADEVVPSDTGTTDTAPLTGELTVPPAHAGEIRSDFLPDTVTDTLPAPMPETASATTPDLLPEVVPNTTPNTVTESLSSRVPETWVETTIPVETEPEPVPETETAREGVWQEAQQASVGMHFEPDPQGGYTLVSVDGGDDRILIVPPLTPDGDPITGIGAGAFADLSELAVLFLPATLERISANAFMNCSHLVNITVDADCAAYSSAGGLLYDRDRTRLLCCPAALEAEQLLLPGSLLYIQDYALYGVRFVRSIEYEGSSEDWALIDIGRGNNLLSILGVVCQGG